MYDIIGDIHGYCSKLEELLTKMDYKKINGTWKHSDRKAIFVGDYIDRGPEIRETLHLVRNMVEAGSAIALMGNHEYNALAFHTQDEKGGYLREHSSKNVSQHSATLAQFYFHQSEWNSFLAWFKELLLFFENDFIRCVHASWDQEHIDWLKENKYLTMKDELLSASHIDKSEAYTVIEETLKGKEFDIPEKYQWLDKDGHVRTANRIKWWVKPHASKWGEFIFDCPDKLKAEKFKDIIKGNIYPADAPPVFFGHYWLEDKFPVIQTANVICVDFSVAKKGALVAYRWNGEKKIAKKHFVSVR
ncbi:MAG: metallophosphoesterase [Chitinophagaceae bacterium]|nr:metallophosphoesterase [Chitinophagaceae bacterium]